MLWQYLLSTKSAVPGLTSFPPLWGGESDQSGAGTQLCGITDSSVASTAGSCERRAAMYPLILWLLGVPVGVIILLLLVGIL
jgi:hypothetical protein